ncbi:MAG: methyltransferase domain-containing protein [Archaeoglobi archaeon]|nr:methyltransferase domain-containing protein [Candidatus Mnemosynella bozhongmuii]
MIQKRRSRKFSKEIFTDEDGLRFATPEIVGEYRAKRLKTDVIGELGCGIGGQTVQFARYSSEVIAAERDEEKLECAKRNARIYGVKNIRFILGDVRSEEVRRFFRDADIIFCDPSRPPEEEIRSFLNFEPRIDEVIELYSPFTENLAFEAPPQIPPARVPFECEKEYISLNHQLNRLNLYFGELKKRDVSAVILPEGEVLYGEGEISYGEIENYLHEPDPAVVKAELLGVLCERFDLRVCFMDGKRILMSGDDMRSPFLKNSYILRGVCGSLSEVREILEKGGAKKAVLRFEIPPSEYWSVRRRLEEGLNGERTFHIFRGDKFIVCERLE